MGRKPREDKPKPHAAQDIGAKAKPFIDRMEYLDAEMKGYREEMAESKKIIVEEAEAAGIQPKALKRILRLRKLQQQIQELPEKLEDIDARAQFLALSEAFGGLPFGDFARQAAAELTDMARDMKAQGVEVSVDFGTGAIHPDDAERREDEAYLDQIGRG